MVTTVGELSKVAAAVAAAGVVVVVVEYDFDHLRFKLNNCITDSGRLIYRKD